jgi:DNA-binding MarR family transcriptional regulator
MARLPEARSSLAPASLGRRPSHDDDGPVTRDAHAPDVGPLGNMVGYALRRAQLAVFDRVIKEFAALDLRPAQFSTLSLLRHRPGMKQSEVAAALGIQRANFVALFDVLEKRGLAERRPNANDRRSHALHLTPAGERLVARAQEIEAAHERHLEQILGPDGRGQLLTLLRQLAERL